MKTVFPSVLASTNYHVSPTDAALEKQFSTPRTACVTILLLLLTLPAVVQAQFNYTTNDGTITIIGYTGSGGDVTIPSTINGYPVTGIGEWAFYATSVTNIMIPDSVTNIADGAFFDCESLTNLTIGDSVTSIGDWTFAFCSSLTSACFRGNAPSLRGVNVFYGCVATVCYLPGTTGWGPAFGGLPAVLWNPPVPYTYTITNGTATITGYTGNGGEVSIPSTISFLAVTSIGDWAFSGWTSLTNVIIPDSVTNIGSSAFCWCLSLTSVTIPNSVTSIGESAFYGCTNLTSATLPNSVTNIGARAFGGCNLTNVTIGNSVTSIGQYAFYRCIHLTSVTIPDSVASIGDWAFCLCTNLTNVTIPGGVTNIGQLAFSGCFSLTAITVHPLNTVYSSAGGVLFNKSQTTLIQYPGGKGGSYTIPGSVTSIGESAFYGCTSLTSVTLPNSVTSIGAWAFGGCNLTSVSIPDSVNSIADRTFIYCNNLTSVTIPSSVTNIGQEAFSCCTSLTSLTIPASVTSIGEWAFSVCFSLTGVYFQGNAPSLGSYVFSGDNNVTTYYLPGTTGWGSTFGGLSTALWFLPNPLILNNSPGFGVKTNRFGFIISWARNTPVVVEACTNLASHIWFPVGTNTLSGGSSYFSDPQWTNFPARFYRRRSP